MHSCTVWKEKLCDGSPTFSTKKVKEITNSKKGKREIRNEKLRKARKAQFEETESGEDIAV